MPIPKLFQIFLQECLLGHCDLQKYLLMSGIQYSNSIPLLMFPFLPSPNLTIGRHITNLSYITLPNKT